MLIHVLPPVLQVFGRDKSMSIVAVMSADQCQAEFGAMLQLSQQVRA